MKDEILIRGLTEENVSVGKGLAKAILDGERGKPYYKWAETGSRDYDVALEERIETPRRNGMLVVFKTDGTVKFDDRKLRYHSHQAIDGKYHILVAPTHFGEAESTNIPGMHDQSFADVLRRKGEEDYQDERAYFASFFAVNSVPVTKDGKIHVFKRSTKVQMFPGYWHVIGGCLDTKLDLFNGEEDPTQKFLNDAKKMIAREYQEEAKCGEVEFQLTGLAGKVPSAVDITYIARIDQTSGEFLAGMKRAEDSSDHTEVLILKSSSELAAFIKNEKKVVPTGLASLILASERL